MRLTERNWTDFALYSIIQRAVNDNNCSYKLRSNIMLFKIMSTLFGQNCLYVWSSSQEKCVNSNGVQTDRQTDRWIFRSMHWKRCIIAFLQLFLFGKERLSSLLCTLLFLLISNRRTIKYNFKALLYHTVQYCLLTWLIIWLITYRVGNIATNV